MTPWQIEPTDQFTTDSAWYAKKRPRELEAVLNNLNRYVSQLKHAKNPLCVQAGYIHPEGHGVVALDQKGGGASLQETRLFAFPDNDKKILYLITIGNKDTQQDDIKLAHRFVSSLKKVS
jgi:hypothetical protein